MHCDIGAAISSSYKVKPNELADCWAAFSLNKNLEKLDVHNYESFRLQIIKTYEGKYGSVAPGAVITRPVKRPASENIVASVTPPSKKNAPNVTKTSSNIENRRVSLSPEEKNSSSMSSTAKVPQYNDRRDPGQIIYSFNPKLLQHVVSSNKRSNPKCIISYSDFDTNATEKYRHMFTTMDERALALDKHLEELGDIIVDRFHLGHGLDESNDTINDIVPIEAVGVARQDKICCIGRICNAVSQDFF